MTALEDLTAGASVRGLTASGAAMVESVQWIGEFERLNRIEQKAKGAKFE